MRFWPEPAPFWLIEPELSSTSATSSVFFKRISEFALKLSSDGLVSPIRLLNGGRKYGRYVSFAESFRVPPPAVLFGNLTSSWVSAASIAPRLASKKSFA